MTWHYISRRYTKVDCTVDWFGWCGHELVHVLDFILESWASWQIFLCLESDTNEAKGSIQYKARLTKSNSVTAMCISSCLKIFYFSFCFEIGRQDCGKNSQLFQRYQVTKKCASMQRIVWQTQMIEKVCLRADASGRIARSQTSHIWIFY